MSWIVEILTKFGLEYLWQIAAAAGTLAAVFFARRGGKKAGRREVERETQQQHAHDVGLANDAENAHRTRTEQQRREAWDKWTVK